MRVTKIVDNIYQFSYDYHGLFEGMWKLDNGVGISSYYIKGDKKVLIDGTVNNDEASQGLYEAFRKIGEDIRELDVLILNHVEPDHTGWLNDLIRVNPEFEVYCMKEAVDVINAFYHFDEPLNIHVVEDGEHLVVGKNLELVFHKIPYVHWPETMMTHEINSNVLFTCDLFGSYHELLNHVYNDEKGLGPQEEWEQETAEYFATVLATFAPFSIKALAKVKELKPELILPGHGLVVRDFKKAMKLYEKLATYQEKPSGSKISLITGSMYGMTDEARQLVEGVLIENDIDYNWIEIPKMSVTEALGSILLSKAVIIGMPTYEYKMFPPMAELLSECERKKLINRKLFRFGSYGWSGGAQRDLENYLKTSQLKWELVDSFEFKGSMKPEEEDVLIEKVEKFLKTIKK